MKSSQLHIAPPELNARRLWEQLALQVREKRGKGKEPFSVALPGGSSLSAFLKALPPQEALSQLGRLSVFSIDERRVALEDPESNMGGVIRAIRATFAARKEKEAKNLEFFPCFGSGPSLPLAEAKQLYESTFFQFTGGKLDLCIIGIGPDGHIASLFPGRQWQAPSTKEHLIMVPNSPKPPPERISLTLNTIASSRAIWLYTFGESKSEAVSRACSGDLSLPLGALLAAAPHAELYLDQAAARLL